MKTRFKHSLRRTVAFVSALALVTSAVFITSFAESKAEGTAKETVKNVDDYTKLFPGLTDTKLKLSDPKFTEKEWYEYIEYEFYTEVKDGDMTYRIYQPTDYSSASVMAITDYNPKEVLGGTSNLTMNLGELQGILDIAAQGGNISKEYVGLNLATGIATQMNSINDVMDNSKYYSSSSFLGIPGDKKFTGVTNDGFFNADSLEIEITETETVSACKTVAMDSSYSISNTDLNEKSKSVYNEVFNAKSNTHEEETYNEKSDSVGVSISDSTSISHEISSSMTSSIGWEIISETAKSQTKSHKDVSSNEWGIEASVGGEIKDTVNIGGGAHYNHGWSDEDETSNTKSSSFSIGSSGSVSSEIGSSIAFSSENSITSNIEKTNTDGKSSADSSTIEHGLTSGNDEGVTHSHANETSVDMGYGVDYQYGNEHSLSVGVTRIFNAREDKEVKNIGWKLCEYVVKIPYYIEAVKTDSTGEEKVLYGQYVNYNLLNGVSRVFANGYIEHWYTGELVTYADFFDGFITATELVDRAKEQQAAKVPKEGG